MFGRLLIAGLLFACVPQGAALASDDGATAGLRSSLRDFQAKEARLFEAGWRLARGNAAYCEDKELSLGWLLHDAAAYGDAAAVRDALGLQGDIAVQAVDSGSPAALAGITADAALISVNEVQIAEQFPAMDPAWQRILEVNRAVAFELSPDSRVVVAWAAPTGDVSAKEILPVETCATRFELTPKGDQALADGERVQFGAEFVGMDYPDDEFAAAVAHELAHNLLRHRVWLDAEGRKRRNLRLTEREADRLMPWLLANAGYPPEAAIRFMERWGPRNDGGLFRKRTHEGWDERRDAIRTEVALVNALISEGKSADWAARFKRDITAP